MQASRWLREPRVFTTADEYEARWWSQVGCAGMSARKPVTNRIALAPGVVGLPAAGGEPQSGNYRMVMSEIYRSNAQVITLLAIAPVTDDRELEGQRGSLRELAGGSNLAGDNAEIARHCGYSPISRSSPIFWPITRVDAPRARRCDGCRSPDG